MSAENNNFCHHRKFIVTAFMRTSHRTTTRFMIFTWDAHEIRTMPHSTMTTLATHIRAVRHQTHLVCRNKTHFKLHIRLRVKTKDTMESSSLFYCHPLTRPTIQCKRTYLPGIHADFISVYAISLRHLPQQWIKIIITKSVRKNGTAGTQYV